MKDNQLNFTSGIYSICQLNKPKFLLYKQMRLEALKTEPAMFRVTSLPETELTDEEWRARTKEPKAVFGLYAMDELVGMTSILLINDDEAYLGQSYIKIEYRGKGLSALFYKIRMAWALEKNEIIDN